MTTIAYHHESETIATDGRNMRGDTIMSDNSEKVIRLPNGSAFLAGNCGDFDLLCDCIRGERIDESIVSLEATAIYVEEGEVYECGYDDGAFWKVKISCNTAIGSGNRFALSAMDFGKDAKQAVEYASTRCPYTGGKIRCYRVNPATGYIEPIDA